ncbi:unnamed protein product [Peniophora sp. CBMAI 1063]|nr:unnamed protein product [Peniophora sp. CBMAI 1063]
MSSSSGSFEDNLLQTGNPKSKVSVREPPPGMTATSSQEIFTASPMILRPAYRLGDSRYAAAVVDSAIGRLLALPRRPRVPKDGDKYSQDGGDYPIIPLRADSAVVEHAPVPGDGTATRDALAHMECKAYVWSTYGLSPDYNADSAYIYDELYEPWQPDAFEPFVRPYGVVETQLVRTVEEGKNEREVADEEDAEQEEGADRFGKGKGKENGSAVSRGLNGGKRKGEPMSAVTGVGRKRGGATAEGKRQALGLRNEGR